MNWALSLRLLPEILLASCAVGILAFQLLGVRPVVNRKLILTVLIVILLVLFIDLERAPQSLWGDLIYFSSWSQLGKIILTGVIIIILHASLPPSGLQDFFLLVLGLTGFLILSTTNIFLVLFCYLWCLMAAFFYHFDLMRCDTYQTFSNWWSRQLITVLMLVTGGIIFWVITGNDNVLSLSPQGSQQLLWPTLFILAGMQHLIGNNYLVTTSRPAFSLVDSLLIPILELPICLALLFPQIGSPNTFLWLLLGLYAIGVSGYANYKIRKQKAYDAVLLNSFRIQNAWFLLALSTATPHGFTLAVYYALAYFYSSGILIVLSAKRQYWPLRLIAWLNLAGLPLTPGFVLRWELVQIFQAAGLGGKIMALIVLILCLITFWNYGRQFRHELKEGLESTSLKLTRQAALLQMLLMLPILIMGSCWSWFSDCLNKLLPTFHPY